MCHACVHVCVCAMSVCAMSVCVYVCVYNHDSAKKHNELDTHTYVDEQVLVYSIGILDHTAISSCWGHGIISPVEEDKLGASVPVEIFSRTSSRDP